MTVNLTEIIVSLIGLAGTCLGIWIPLYIGGKMEDKRAAEVYANAVKNSVGALVEAGKEGIRDLKPQVYIPGVPPAIQPAVQYVLDHAEEEARRVDPNLTPEKIAEKVVAQIGLTKIADPGADTTAALNRAELERVTQG